jgi:hypothetical protein
VTLDAVTEAWPLPVGTSNSGEKVLNMDKNSKITKRCMGPSVSSGHTLLRAPEWGRQQLLGKLKCWSESQTSSPHGRTNLDYWQLPCSCAPYLHGTHGILHKNRLGLRLKEKILFWDHLGPAFLCPQALQHK